MQNLDENGYVTLDGDGYELPTVSGQASTAAPAPVYESLRKSPDGTGASNRYLIITIITCSVLLVVCIAVATTVIILNLGSQTENGEFNYIMETNPCIRC